MTRFLPYLRTVKHLKFRQIFYRGYYYARKRLAPVAVVSNPATPGTRQLSIKGPVSRPCSFSGTKFTFLNRTHKFSGPIDWNFPEYGKLWCYNLNYFDFLNQPDMSRESGLSLLHDFRKTAGSGSVGLEPYPTSLRIINWIKFLSLNEIQDLNIDDSLYAQAQHLSKNLEYHLLGNHLLENGFALLIASCYFDDDVLYTKARKILEQELAEQVLPDGGHFELSPMYHQIILDRLLDCINFLRCAKPSDDLLILLDNKASIMLDWLEQVTFRNGEIPLVNDAAFGIAPTTKEIIAYAGRLGIEKRVQPIKESGYRKICRDKYEILVDVGNIGPDYIPGHAHSDTFNFVLYRNGKPFIVDTGTSTYETCERRLTERRTASHNTVQVDTLEQSEVWGSFRVARRAYVRDLVEADNTIAARHNGYDRIGASHRREFVFDDQKILINDLVDSKKSFLCQAFFHFHPDVEVNLDANRVIADGARITFGEAARMSLEEYIYAPKFNVLVPGKVLKVSFENSLTTTLCL